MATRPHKWLASALFHWAETRGATLNLWHMLKKKGTWPLFLLLNTAVIRHLPPRLSLIHIQAPFGWLFSITAEFTRGWAALIALSATEISGRRSFLYSHHVFRGSVLGLSMCSLFYFLSSFSCVLDNKSVKRLVELCMVILSWMFLSLCVELKSGSRIKL